MLRKQKTRAWLLSLAAVVLLMSNYFVGWAEEPDPRILWVADSSIGRIDGFAVHPNGNIFAYHGSNIFEIDGTNGKLLRKLPKFSKDDDIESLDISNDGKYLATSYDVVTIIDLSDLSFKVLGKGNLVTFNPNSNKIAYRARTNPPGTTGHDSSIVILDLTTQERSYIKTEELIHKISFSPDGRFLATGGTGELYGNSYTSLKLWDAKTLKLIKELERIDGENPIEKIQFSQDNRFVAFTDRANTIIYIFDSESLNLIKYYSKKTFGEYMTDFTWLSNNNYVIINKQITICRLTDDLRKIIYEFPNWVSQIETDYIKNRFITRTGNFHLGGFIISWDIDKILSIVKENEISKTITVQYIEDTLIIKNFIPKSSNTTFRIFDVNGKFVKQFELSFTNSEVKIPIKLINGTYILQVQDGSQQYSSKFLVTE